MPNGRPGDHPYTDIVLHEADIYTQDIRDHVLAIEEYGNPGAIHRVSSLLWKTPTDSRHDEIQALERNLQSVHAATERSNNYPVESPLAGCLEDAESVYSEPIRELVREIHEQLQDEINEKDRGQKILSGLLWQRGWQPADTEALESELREFRADHWIWDH